MEITKDDVIGSTTEHQRVEIPVWSQRMKQQLADKNAKGKVVYMLVDGQQRSHYDISGFHNYIRYGKS
jgi:hypothetical protein